jgi:hypothetical protein
MPRSTADLCAKLTIGFGLTLAAFGCKTDEKRPEAHAEKVRAARPGNQEARPACRTPAPRATSLVGGFVDDEQFPATVALGMHDPSGRLTHTCTGTFVRDDAVVTSAHCVADYPAGEVESISFAADILQLKTGGTASTTKWAVHPDYQQRGSVTKQAKNDAMVVFFPRKSFTGSLPRIATRSIAANEAITLVGYGHTWIDPDDVMKSGAGDVRKVGYNRIDEVYDDVLFWSAQNRRGSGVEQSFAYINHGDSGGPVLGPTGDLAGLMSRLSLSSDASGVTHLTSWATDITHVASFLQAQLGPLAPQADVTPGDSESAQELATDASDDGHVARSSDPEPSDEDGRRQESCASDG